MGPEVALLTEVWDIVKNHVHINERHDVCDALLRSIDEHVGLPEEDLNMHKNEFDRIMKAAIIEYLGDDELNEDDTDEEW
jgi:hypothetical protein